MPSIRFPIIIRLTKKILKTSSVRIQKEHALKTSTTSQDKSKEESSLSINIRNLIKAERNLVIVYILINVFTGIYLAKIIEGSKTQIVTLDNFLELEGVMFPLSMLFLVYLVGGGVIIFRYLYYFRIRRYYKTTMSRIGSYKKKISQWIIIVIIGEILIGIVSIVYPVVMFVSYCLFLGLFYFVYKWVNSVLEQNEKRFEKARLMLYGLIIMIIATFLIIIQGKENVFVIDFEYLPEMSLLVNGLYWVIYSLQSGFVVLGRIVFLIGLNDVLTKTKKMDTLDISKQEKQEKKSFCSNCRMQVSNDASFCEECGNEINKHTEFTFTNHRQISHRKLKSTVEN